MFGRIAERAPEPGGRGQDPAAARRPGDLSSGRGRQGEGRKEPGGEQLGGKEEAEARSWANSPPSVRVPGAPHRPPLAPRWALRDGVSGREQLASQGADPPRGEAPRPGRPRAASANSPCPRSKEAFHAHGRVSRAWRVRGSGLCRCPLLAVPAPSSQPAPHGPLRAAACRLLPAASRPPASRALPRARAEAAPEPEERGASAGRVWPEPGEPVVLPSGEMARSPGLKGKRARL